jgi:replication factor C subunit 2/4
MNKNTLPWIEKYRPHKLEDLILASTCYTKIKKIIDDKELNNIIFTGEPGIGKTSTINLIARALYGEYYKDMVLEINASDDRGIKTVQETVTNFCKKKIFYKEADNNKYSKHKLIILDEVDNMTTKAQKLICNLMEIYYKTTRFALSCNNSFDIIEGIQSRCFIMRYQPIKKEDIIKRLKKICEIEKVSYEEEALILIADISLGDIRSAINNLQLVYNAYNDIITDYVYKICNKPQPELLIDIINNCLKKKMDIALKKILNMKKIGYVNSDIISGLYNIVASDKINIEESIKFKILNEISKTNYIIAYGFDTSNIQLAGCIAKIIMAISS